MKRGLIGSYNPPNRALRALTKPRNSYANPSGSITKSQLPWPHLICIRALCGYLCLYAALRENRLIKPYIGHKEWYQNTPPPRMPYKALGLIRPYIRLTSLIRPIRPYKPLEGFTSLIRRLLKNI